MQYYIYIYIYIYISIPSKYSLFVDTQQISIQCFNRARRDKTREEPTTARETGREKPAPVSIEGADAGAISVLWADTEAAIARVAKTNTIITFTAFDELLTFAIVFYIILLKVLKELEIAIRAEQKWFGSIYIRVPLRVSYSRMGTANAAYTYVVGDDWSTGWSAAYKAAGHVGTCMVSWACIMLWWESVPKPMCRWPAQN